MKSLAAAPLLLIALAGPALAQTPSTEPKAVKTIPIRPDGSQGKAAAPQTPADTAKAMQQTERTAIQSDLAWVGAYNGAVNGEVSERMINAIKTFQKDQNAKQTGVLNPQERQQLAAAAKKLQNDVGWKVAQDPINGIRLGVPTKLVPQMSSMANTTGSKWSSAQGQIQIETWRLRDANQTIAAVAEQQKKEPAGRKVDYSVVRPDFFVLSGLQGLKKFYVRGQIKDGEVRGMTILYDQATEGTMAPVVIAMSSAFTPFPASAAQAAAPPPRKKVEYATGIVVSTDGAIITDRQAVDGCQFIVVPGHGNADRVAEDKARDLALLRIYGARELKPIAIGGAAKSSVVLTGIADPQSQGGGAAASSTNATLTATSMSPAPGIGFTGAAAVDAEGVFAGMTLLKPVVVAGTQPPQTANEAAIVPADQVLGFLKAHDVTPATGKAGAKAAVLRVVCVRK
jgi:peptidoglycan hydrolase-like protein with peptidoglycan-binding domain